MTDALHIRDLRKTFPGGLEALKGIDLRVESGDFFALLGPNGAGKSTTLGVLASLVRKTSGQVSVFDADLDTDPARLKTYLGFVPQEFNFNQFERVGDIVRTQAGYYGMPPKAAARNAERYLRELGLWDKRNSPARMLSGGMKRRLLIARALVHEPRVLILDEPTAGVDIELRRSMWAFMERINREGVTIILTTHYLEEAEQMADRIGVINAGEIILVENKNELMQKLGEKRLTIELQDRIAAVPEALAMHELELKDDGAALLYTYNANDKRTGINTLFRDLDAAGLRLRDVDTKQSSLEEIFVDLVKDDT